jgi:hypothetical protein
LLFTAIAASILLLFSPWGAVPRLGRVDDYLVKIGIGVLLLTLALLARRSRLFEKYWQVLFALFILTVSISLEWIFGNYVSGYQGVKDVTPAGWAFGKLNECFVTGSVIVIFTLLSGGSLGSIYIQRGNLKLGLIIGTISFFIFAAGSVPMATLFNANNLTPHRIIPWIPWILIFVLANGTLEEMLFGGLFL